MFTPTKSILREVSNQEEDDAENEDVIRVRRKDVAELKQLVSKLENELIKKQREIDRKDSEIDELRK